MKNIKKTILVAAAGVLSGLVNGFFGSGGGIIAVEGLRRAGTNVKSAHATAISVIFPLSLFSALAYHRAGYLDVPAFLWTGAGALAGGLIGALLLGKTKPKILNRIFTLLILASGIRLLV